MIFTIQVEGAEKLKLDLAGMSERARFMAPALERVRLLLEAGERAQFDTRGAFFGTPWAALKESTITREGEHSPLDLAGNLRASLTGGKGKVTPTTVTVGPGLWYGRFAQKGTSRGEPRRPIVGVASRTLGASLEMILRYLLGEL